MKELQILFFFFNGDSKGNGDSKQITVSQNTGQGGSCHVPLLCPKETRTEHPYKPYKFDAAQTCKRPHLHTEATP